MTAVETSVRNASIVINTYNRARMLDRTIESLRWLHAPTPFEVIVVNGPSSDATEEVLSRHRDYIRVGSTPHANLAISRNVGIQMARGDIVAFLDDDAIPEPAWLRELSNAYLDPQVGAAGGFVFDHTGYSYQYKYATADRLGVADLTPTRAQPNLSYPSSFTFPHLLGTNSSFRRAALQEIGGFDEEFEYYLDESDVQARLVDAGFIVAQVPTAVVHHHFAPSNMRGHNRVAKRRYAILKNKFYFSLKHGRPYFSLEQLIAEQSRFIEQQRADVTWAVSNGLLSQVDLDQFETDVEKSTEIGLSRGLEGQREPSIDVCKESRTSLAPFPVLTREGRMTLALVSQEYPPDQLGGIGTFTHDSASELAALGHDVHVITKSSDINRVDYEHGVWVHRLNVRESAAPAHAEVPQHIWNWSATALAEVERLDLSQPVDAVEAPVWDAQGVAFLLDGRWPLVTSLQTTLRTWLDTHPQQARDPEWMASFGNPMLALETRLMRESHAVRAISAAIRDDLSELYGVEFSDDRTVVAHLGVTDPLRTKRVAVDKSPSPREEVVLLFVGRLEARKGIDTLLEAFVRAHAAMPNLVLKVVGDDTLPIGDGVESTFREAFEARPSPASSAVTFLGKLTEHDLRLAYARSDVFVAPSRYESFGLVFAEAMSHGVPVVGTLVGGIPEVVREGITGFLVPVADPDALADAILKLAGSASLRERMGRAARKHFEDEFTSTSMAVRCEPVYRLAILNKRA